MKSDTFYKIGITIDSTDGYGIVRGREIFRIVVQVDDINEETERAIFRAYKEMLKALPNDGSVHGSGPYHHYRHTGYPETNISGDATTAKLEERFPGALAPFQRVGEVLYQ